jgi:hypothetical protein
MEGWEQGEVRWSAIEFPHPLGVVPDQWIPTG